MRSIKSITIVLGLFIVSSHPFAGIIKWTDADGKVHYSDQPAPKNVKTTNVTIEDPIPVSPDAKQKLQSYQNVIEEGRKKRLLEKAQEEKAAADKKSEEFKAAKAASEAEEKSENDGAQQNLNAGTSATPNAAGYTGYTPLVAPTPSK
jgi:vacuolar-type H+-ATPase subunit I/STV1